MDVPEAGPLTAAQAKARLVDEPAIDSPIAGAREWVRRNPVGAVAIAAGLGIAIARSPRLRRAAVRAAIALATRTVV